MSQAEANKAAGKLSLVRDTRPGHIERVGFGAELTRVAYGYYTIRAVKLSMGGEY